MKKNTKIIFTIVVILIVAVLLGVQYYFNKETEKLKEENEKMNIFEITTKSGEKIVTEYNKFDDSFLLKIPTSFKLMDEETLKIKYPNQNPPTFAFTNDQTTINIAANITDISFTNNDIDSYISTLEKTLDSVGEIIDTKVHEKDGHKIGEIKFISHAIDTDIYNHMMIFSDKEKLRIVSFNVTKELQDDWQTVGEFIIDSIIFSEDK